MNELPRRPRPADATEAGLNVFGPFLHSGLVAFVIVFSAVAVAAAMLEAP